MLVTEDPTLRTLAVVTTAGANEEASGCIDINRRLLVRPIPGYERRSMAKCQHLQPDASARGIRPAALVRVGSVHRFGSVVFA